MNNVTTNTDIIFQHFVIYLFNPILQLATVLSILYFLYGIMMYVWQMNNPEKMEDGKRHLLWGSIGILIIFSINGILILLNSTVGGMFQY